MMITRLAPAALAALFLLGACTPEPAETQSPTASTPAATPSITPSPSPSPTASPSPTSTLSPEQEAAQAAAVEYFRALNAVRSDPDADFQQVADVTTGTHTSAEAQLISDYRSKGIVQVGENTYTYKGWARWWRPEESSPSKSASAATAPAATWSTLRATRSSTLPGCVRRLQAGRGPGGQQLAGERRPERGGRIMLKRLVLLVLVVLGPCSSGQQFGRRQLKAPAAPS